MNAIPSSLYFGNVIHSRLRPKRHRLRYKAFWLLLDIDAIEPSAGRLRFLSRNRFNLFSVHDRDYGAASEGSLREQVDHALLRDGGQREAGRVLLLTMPRILGYAFNPLSVYFCYGADGRLATIIYEVHNTFGERHKYVMAVDPTAVHAVLQGCEKTFHVSPFMAMEVAYAFRVNPPGERISIAIQGSDADGPIINTVLAGERAELTDAGLLRAFFSIPLLTLKVILAIHWEALRMWLKGFRVFPHPADRSEGVYPEVKGPTA